MVWVAYCVLLLDSRVFKVGLLPNLKIVKYKTTSFSNFCKCLIANPQCAWAAQGVTVVDTYLTCDMACVMLRCCLPPSRSGEEAPW